MLAITQANVEWENGLKDLQCFLIQAHVDANLGNIRCVITIEFMDVVHYSTLVGLSCRKDQKVLERFVVAEWRRLENDLFEEFYELLGQVGL
jgi:hypothetical protein